MLIYLALIVALSLACAVGLWFFYSMFVRAVNHFDEKRFNENTQDGRARFVNAEINPFSSIAKAPRIEPPVMAEPEEDIWPDIVDA